MRVVSNILMVGGVVTATRTEVKQTLDGVIKMVENMKTKSEEAEQQKKTIHAEYTTTTGNMIEKLEFGIKTEQEKIDEESANIEASLASIDEESENIADASKCLQMNEADTTYALAADEQARKKYQKAVAELQDAVYACDKAIEVLSSVKNLGAKNLFTQLSSELKGFNGASTLLAQVEALMAAEQPQGNVVASSNDSSQQITGMVEELKSDFQKELNTTTSDETQREGAHKMRIQSLEKAKEDCENDKKTAESTKATAEKALGEAKKAKKEAEQSKKAKTLSLKKTKDELKQKSEVFAEQMTTHNEEQNVLGQAIDVLTKSAGATTAASGGLFLIQIKSKQRDAPDGERVADFLRARGKALKSDMLMQLSETASAAQAPGDAGNDPLLKIKGMISDMILKIKDDMAKAELKFGSCNKQYAANKKNLNKFSTEQTKQKSIMDQLEAKIEMLKESIAENQECVATCEKDQTERHKIRMEEKDVYDNYETEMTKAQTALTAAIELLSGFYDKQDDGSAANANAGKVVIGVLEQVEVDNSKSMTEAETEENQAQRSYTEWSAENEKNKKTCEANGRSDDEDHAQSKEDHTDATSAEENARSSLKDEQGIKKIIDKECTAPKVSFEDMMNKRQAEVDSLKDALKILGDVQLNM